MRGRVHEHQDVERVAIVAERGGDEAEIEGKHHAFGQQAAEHEEIGFGVVIEFVATAFGRLDDSAASAFPGVELVREGRQICHNYAALARMARASFS